MDPVLLDDLVEAGYRLSFIEASNLLAESLGQDCQVNDADTSPDQTTGESLRREVDPQDDGQSKTKNRHHDELEDISSSVTTSLSVLVVLSRLMRTILPLATNPCVIHV